MASTPEVHGIVVVDKPAGKTSHDIVYAIRKLFQTRKVGHTGTLDPDATGVLVVCLGHGTRLAEYLSASRKHYSAEFVFGQETDTQDASGTVLGECDASYLTETMVRDHLHAFRGAIQQIPPMVSAVHHEGRRLYEIAREGGTVERLPRDVTIDVLELVAFRAGKHPVVALEITCSTGTYIRTLAADLGTKLEVGGHMRSLRRTWVGSGPENAFTLEAAFTLDQLRDHAAAGSLAEVILPLAAGVQNWPAARCDAMQLGRIRNGQSVALDEIGTQNLFNWPWSAGSAPVAVVDSSGTLCAVARRDTERLFPVKVLMLNECL